MRYVIKELLRHRLRNLFSIAGYVIATVFIILILCITRSNDRNSLGILQSTGTHFIAYIPTDQPSCTSGSANGSVIAEGVRTMMMDSSVLKKIEDIKGVRDAAPCILYQMYDEEFGKDITLSGIDTASIATASTTCSKSNLISGRFPGNPNELVAEQSFASAHGLAPGDTLHIFGGRMVVAGLVNSGIKPVKADFYAPIAHVRSILKDNLQCNAPLFDMNIALVEVADARVQDQVMASIRNMMYNFAVSSYNCYVPAYQVMSIIDRSSVGLTLMIFVFLVLISAKTQLTSLMERFREIGILKSLGWSDLRLSGGIIAISVFHAVAGVTLGIIAGAMVIALLNNIESPVFTGIAFRFQFSGIPLLYSLSIAGALIAAFFPVRRILITRAGDIIKNHM